MNLQPTLRSMRAVFLLIAVAFQMTAPLPAGAQEQAAAARVTASIVDQNSSLPVANATVQLLSGEDIIAVKQTDSAGQAAFANVKQGVYRLALTANGYEPGISEEFVAAAGQTTTVRTVMIRSATNSASSGLRQIASVTAHRGALQTSSVITQHVSAQTMMKEGLLRVGDALLTLPDISANDLDSAPGDDLHLNVRGMKGSETAALLDGHPIGPIGVGSGDRGGFNYQLSPAWSLNNVQVAYGSGALALYGSDTVAGAVDFQTIEPTRGNEAALTQGLGTQGRTLTTLTATGSAGRFSYALDTGVQGTWDGFRPQMITQTGLLNNNISPANVAANTWLVTGDYILRSSLAKLRYDASPGTSITLTGYDATSWDDKTGQGDNDAWTSAYAGAIWGTQAGSTPGCSGVPVVIDNSGNTQCFNQQQYEAAFAGPQGGTPLAWQAQRLQDYSLRLNSQHRNNVLSGQVWLDNYFLLYNRDNTGHTNGYQSTGEEVADDIVTAQNDFGFGVYGYGQTETDQTFDVNANPGVVTNPNINESTFNYFVRDTFTPTTRLSAFASAWLKNSSVTKTTTLDPRLTLLYRPTAHDVIRVSAGKAQGIPAIGLLQGAPAFDTTPANLIGHINCSANGLTSVANSSNPTLGAEKATDEEISVGHQFSDDSNIQVIGFDTNMTNVIFPAVIPLGTLGLTPPPQYTYGPGGYLSVIGTCNPGATVANLGVTTNANAGAGRFRGFDITGRVRASRQFYLDYSYDVLSARYFGIPTLALVNNVTLIDGGQLDKVPVHQGSLGFDYSASGWEARFDGYYVGINNGLLRPAYTYANASLSKRLSNKLTVNLGVYNVFNSQYDQYGRIGYGTFQPENQYGTDANALQQAVSGVDGEQFGLPQRSFLFTVTTRM